MCSIIGFPRITAPSFPIRRSALQRFQVLQCDCARFQKIGYKQARRSVEQLKEVSNQIASELTAIDYSLEQLSIADFLHLAQSPFLLQPVYERLNRRISNTLLFRQAVQNLAHRARSKLPVLLQNSCLGFRKA